MARAARDREAVMDRSTVDAINRLAQSDEHVRRSQERLADMTRGTGMPSGASRPEISPEAEAMLAEVFKQERPVGRP